LVEPASRRIALATGLTYHLLDWPAADGVAAAAPQFVLVHGFTDLARGWDGVSRALVARGRVIAPDLRGHGDSDWIGAGGYYHFFDYVADLDEVITRTAGTEPIVLVGHSMGGSICGYWAGTRPERVRALVLIEGLGPPDASNNALPLRTAAWSDAWRTARGRVRVMASLDDAAARLRAHDPLLGDAAARQIARHGTRSVDGGLVWKHDPLHATMGPYPYRLDVAEQFWRRVACPVLCIDGEQSRMNLAADERARRRAVFARCTHAVVATSARPRPTPPNPRSSELSPWRNGSKIASRSSGGMPTPVSRTTSTTRWGS
jgi:pimeloyl-ACP methyl ester carboxylesterase